MTRTWVIGKCKDCDVIVDRPTVSDHHCRLVREGDGFALEDLGSSNGTYVNDERIASRTRLSLRDAVTLGRHVPMPWPAEAIPPAWRCLRIGREPDNDFLVNLPNVSGYHARVLWNGETGEAILEDLGSSNGTAIGSPERRITRSVLAATDTVYLGSHPLPATVLVARLASVRVPFLTFRGSSMIIGRDPGCDVVLDLPMVSGRHARLRRSGNSILIEDLGSAHGTCVNGRRIDRSTAVRPGDMICLGKSTLQLAVADPGSEPEEPPAKQGEGAVEPPPTPWWSETRPTIAGILRPGWRLAVLLAQAPLAAGLIVLAFLVPVDTGMNPQHGAGLARSPAAGLFWLGFTAVAIGLTGAFVGGATHPGAPSRVPSGRRFTRPFTRIAVLGSLCALQCTLALAIVHPGMSLQGPGLPMLGLLLLASAVGLSLGLALASLVPRPAIALALIPLGLVPMWLFGGQRQPLARMSPIARRAANALPCRWAFEGLLLLEMRREPSGDAPSTPPVATPDHDLAAPYFPAETERMGLRAGTLALGSMLIGLTALIAFLSGVRSSGG